MATRHRTWKYPRLRPTRNPIERAQRAEEKQLNRLEPRAPRPLTIEELEEDEAIERGIESRRMKGAMAEAFVPKEDEKKVTEVEGMDAISKVSKIVELALINNVPVERWIKVSGKGREQREYKQLYAYDFEVEKWGMPQFAIDWLHAFGGFVHDSSVGHMRLSHGSLKMCTYKCTYAAIDIAESKKKMTPLQKKVVKALEDSE